MVYVRGHARDYDRWAEQGAEGWAFADVAPYFDRMENWDPAGHGGDPDWRGKGGTSASNPSPIAVPGTVRSCGIRTSTGRRRT